MSYSSSTRSAILYLSYDGILEPLGESQVLNYLERLSVDYDIALISFEKPSDTSEENRLLKYKTRLEEGGIRWYPLRYHKTPPVLSTAYDVVRAWWQAIRWQRRNQRGIAHARGYVAGLVALFVKRRGRIRFLFDMRGFWPEEKVEAGHWRNSSIPYQVAKWCERRFFERSDAIVSLTDAGVAEFKTLGYKIDPNLPVKVIPTCVDMHRFCPGTRDQGLIESLGLAGCTVIGCVGTMSGWYLRQDMLSYIALCASQLANVKVLVVTREDHDQLQADAKLVGLDSDRLVLVRATFEEMPTFIRLMDFGLFFIRSTFSKKGSAATKLGEFLACGVPVVINAGVGDSDRIVRRGRTGVVLSDMTRKSFEESMQAVQAMLIDSDTRHRCRQTAEDIFDLDQGVRAYKNLYDQLFLATHVN
ncbi:hypothetical protein EVA25_02970 [bacterium]|nr:MAG: hypothetical protein EVA25_02970 [bacterium]